MMSEKQPLILCIETATEVCSAALFEGTDLLAEQSGSERYEHAEQLHPYIKTCIEEGGPTMDDIDAAAVSIGPGSYTGLRIGLSAAQGLSFALNIPLLGIPTLESLASAALRSEPSIQRIAPMIDARRMEVYTAVFNAELNRQLSARALILEPESLADFRSAEQPLYVCGNGCEKWRDQAPQEVIWLPDTICSARHLIHPALKKWREKQTTSPVNLQPMYIKSPHISRPQQTSE